MRLSWQRCALVDVESRLASRSVPSFLRCLCSCAMCCPCQVLYPGWNCALRCRLTSGEISPPRRLLLRPRKWLAMAQYGSHQVVHWTYRTYGVSRINRLKRYGRPSCVGLEPPKSRSELKRQQRRANRGPLASAKSKCWNWPQRATVGVGRRVAMSSGGGGNKPRHARRQGSSGSRRPHYDGDGSERGARSQTNQLRRQAAISLSSFSSKKGHDRALQEYKKRKETNFNKNAVLLRQYQRAMKSEGYEAGKGASRKRDRSEGGNTTRSMKQSHDAEDDRPAGQVASPEKKRKRHKPDPLYQARRKAEQRKAEQQDKAQQKQKRIQDEGQKQVNRKKTARKYMERTRRGQPVMKNVISGMLAKIQNGSR